MSTDPGGAWDPDDAPVTAGVVMSEIPTPVELPTHIVGADLEPTYSVSEAPPGDYEPGIATSLQLHSGLSFSAISLSLSGSVDDWAPDNGSTGVLWRLNNTAGASVNINGMVPQDITVGEAHMLHNVSADNIVLVH